MKMFIVLAAVFLLSQACIPGHASLAETFKHLENLNHIAYQNSGNRASSSSGYDASVDFILQSLNQVDLDVKLQSFSYPVFRFDGTPKLSQTAPGPKTPFVYGTDFLAFTGIPSGEGNEVATTAVPNLGCHEDDYKSFTKGNVALVKRGTCTFSEKARLAASNGASAIVIFNNDGGAFNGRADDPGIPVFSLSHWLGSYLYQTAGVRMSFSVKSISSEAFTTNLIAETKTGSPDSVIVVGSHLDSVPAGPGINDNGSGSATNLELALATARCGLRPRNKIRFAWWGAEELGLLGSHFYVDDLSPAERHDIALNLNFDMLGSPNYIFGIYNGSGAPEPIRNLSAKIQDKFEEVFRTSLRKPYVLLPFDGRSDYGPFIEAGIPAGGLATGAEGIKTMEERTLFKGLANAWYDPCYHNACDNIDNIGFTAIENNLKAAATVLESFATNPIPPRPRMDHQRPLEYKKDPKAIARI